MQKFDLHMHTSYCDGNDSAEEMILAAIDKGLEVVGISGHSFTAHDPSYCMSREGTSQYIGEVRALKQRYAGRIKVLLGIEMDYYATADPAPYDYRIGSVHYIFTPEGEEAWAKGEPMTKFRDWSDVDDEPYDLRRFANELGIDMMSVAEMYFETAGRIIRQTDCDIVGHFDLLTKFNERYLLDPDDNVIDTGLAGHGCDRTGEAPDLAGEMSAASELQSGAVDGCIRFFDTDDPRYIAAWHKAIDRIFEDCAERYACGYRNRLETAGILTAGDKPVFEINLGAIAKQYRTSPYPSHDQIEYIRSRGGILILDSDSHSTANVAYRFREYEGWK